MDRIREYLKKGAILRRIMSNKAELYRRINAAQNITTVVVSSLLLFIGFSGTDKIQTYLNWMTQTDKIRIEFGFNLLVFALFVLATLHLVFHFGKKQTDAEHAIVLLTSLINQLDDLLAREEQGLIRLSSSDVDLIRHKYESITATIPANSDSEHEKARKEYQDKERRRDSTLLTPQGIFNKNQQENALRMLVLRSDQAMTILTELRKIDPKLYLGGGLVRNLVWDHLHGFVTPTAVDDVDVVYYDKLSASKDHDLQFEQRLRAQIPNLQWSVKNQARMHVANNDQEYVSLLDAISKWPETATAIAARLTDNGDVEFITPHGLSDLFRLLIRPTPHFLNNLQRINDRATTKHWQTTWPSLQFFPI